MRGKLLLHSVVASSALLGALVTAPQAGATEKPIEKPTVTLSADADANTRMIVAEDPSAVAAAATICGAGFDKVSQVKPLPEGVDPRERLAALFTYIGNNGRGCALLDNNAVGKKYMHVGVCDIDGKNCDTDSGYFSEHAGPVYVPKVACAPVTAKAGQSPSSLYINFTSRYVFPCN
ncbi:hypothetical protein OYE22_11100 [Streptomyces sp. 71268]|uniref:hypothetical protein n=1 Tax=Streptomyces sp. 71268 TaxID=3002640 RepID=UPI0023F863A5|nr:hypothetical protein [Streptomyces sp. 71268]WEV25683.1 hypothetical protein OYE22_11100 [Streptomyces sp. 71268]